jgi:hypothetical protein
VIFMNKNGIKETNDENNANDDYRLPDGNQ